MQSADQILEEILQRSQVILQNIRAEYFAPDAKKYLKRRFSITETGQLVGKSAQAIRDAEAQGKVPEPEKDPKTNRRTGYRIEEVNRLRDYFGSRPFRGESDDPCVLAVQNFKGGVGKSAISTHLAQYLAIKGYRVLVVDCDSQATTTASFGYIPDEEISPEETLLPFFEGSESDLGYCIKETYWDGLHLVPSCLLLYNAEYSLAGYQAHSDPSEYKFYHQLGIGLETVKYDYDVILIDSPPALGMISMNVLYAANAIIIPVPPAMYDFSSTIQFFKMLREVMTRIGEEKTFSFFRILISKYESASASQNMFLQMMRDLYGRFVMDSVMSKTAEIQNASTAFSSVYELEGASTSRRTYARALTILDTVNGEIEQLVRLTWPTHAKRLREKGIIGV